MREPDLEDALEDLVGQRIDAIGDHRGEPGERELHVRTFNRIVRLADTERDERLTHRKVKRPIGSLLR